MSDALSPPRFWLQRLTLKNFRCFDDLTVELDKQLTVLIARNGAGKTAILDALVISIGTFVGSFDTGKGKGILNQDVRMAIKQREPLRMAPQYPVVMSAKGEIYRQQKKWERRLNTKKSKTTIKDATPLTKLGKRMQAAVTDGGNVLLPLIAYYGTARLWRQKKKTLGKTVKIAFDLRTTGYLDCLDPESSYSYFKEWFIHYSEVVAEVRNRLIEEGKSPQAEGENPYAALIKVVQRAVDVCLALSGWRNLRYSFIHKDIVMEHPQHGVLNVEQLSDGVRNMVAMVADIAFRMVQLNAHEGENAAQCTPGLILIDEVDMHLHPEWQQVVLDRLVSAFPQAQFVVTTHSPQVLSTVPREKVRVIAENIEGRLIAEMPMAETYGRSNSDVMHAVMGVAPEPMTPDTEELRKYLSLVEQSEAQNAELSAMRGKLEKIFGADHPFFIRADMITRRKEALRRCAP